ncbi:NAD(P)/FAD-dependent oxidoreductase [Capillimicrobium parvum]|uniref:Renalase n=1 Tax=Capillimicrobium parvum TaxID=2884022 RepID=A0A9E6XWW2_9ACTN|nr:FAD-dependent oxidoreductase [Capillimicrobium parvum]UGS35884.1 Renalase [Capillimicrobium parvum]
MGRKIAIVGTGIAGLAAAHALHTDHDITVFEADDRPGGHAHTHRVETPTGHVDVDTGFIVFNDRNYPSFQRLLADVRVAARPSDMSFSVSDGLGDFEYNGSSPNGLFAKRAHLVTPWFHRMIADLVRFNREARDLLTADLRLSLRDWLEDRRFSTPFIERLIVPQASAVWSADPRRLWSFPARFLAEFFANHGMLGLRNRPRWRTIDGGSHRYVRAVVDPWRDRLRLSTPVAEIRRGADHVTVVARGGEAQRFDDVVLAVHSDQALRMLADPSDREHEILGAIPYQLNEAVLHTDRRMLPRRRRAWASWNYHLLEAPAGRPTLTYHMNRLQSLDPGCDLCVTLNHTAAIDPGHVLKTIRYAHPVFTPEGVAAQARHHEISGPRTRTHYCGAYWGWGFHEDGVVSAERVAAALR